MKKIRLVAKGIVLSITTFLFLTIFAMPAQAATMTFHNFNVCYGNYGYVERWSYTDYSWGEEFWLGKRDHWTFIRADRASYLDSTCRTWRA